jgi:thiol-disulfide isomerase/thioredoxin
MARTSTLPTEGRFPSLVGATDWIHSPPLDPAGQRGKVVLIDFCTYTCINWLRTLSYVRAWAGAYRDDGLVVIGVHTPEFSFEHDLDNVRRAFVSMNVDWPIAVDNDYAVWDAFANHYWPALYFIDAEGASGITGSARATTNAPRPSSSSSCVGLERLTSGTSSSRSTRSGPRSRRIGTTSDRPRPTSAATDRGTSPREIGCPSDGHKRTSPPRACG